MERDWKMERGKGTRKASFRHFLSYRTKRRAPFFIQAYTKSVIVWQSAVAPSRILVLGQRLKLLLWSGVRAPHSQNWVGVWKVPQKWALELGSLASQEWTRRTIAEAEISLSEWDVQPETTLRPRTSLHMSLLGVSDYFLGQSGDSALPASRSKMEVNPTHLEI